MSFSIRKCDDSLRCCVVTGLATCVLALPAAPLAAQSAPLPQSTANAQDQPIKLTEFLVTDERQSGYLGSHAMGATRTGTPLIDTPQTVNVITKELYQDLQAFETQDA